MKKEIVRRVVQNKPCIIGVVLIIIALCMCLIPGMKLQSEMSFFQDSKPIIRICELATLRNYYHNVIVYVKEPDGGDKFFNDVLIWPFGPLIRKGYKQFWIEYSGIVEMGIDASQIRISNPNSMGVVNVYVPDAKVLNVLPDVDSFSEPITELGLFTSISGKEKLEALSRAQEVMNEEAKNDQTQLFRAQNNAKTLLERYIINFGKDIGKNYTVNWIVNPE